MGQDPPAKDETDEPLDEEEAPASLSDLDRDDPLWAQGAERWTILDEVERRYAAGLRFYLHWKKAAIVIAIGGVAGVGLTKALPTQYESDTVICFRPGIRAGQSEKNDDSLRNLSGAIQELTLSTPVLEGVVREFRLHSETWKKDDISEAVRKVRESITFEKRTEDAYSIKYAGMSPKEAKAVTERLGEGVDASFRKIQSRLASMNDGFMTEERKLRGETTAALELALGDFLIAHPKMAEDPDFTHAPGAVLRSDEAVRKAEASVGAPIDEEALAALESRKRLVDMELGRARQVESDARRSHAELAAQYTDKHPEVGSAATTLKLTEVETGKKEAESLELALKIKKVSQGLSVSVAKEADPYLAAELGKTKGPPVMLNDAGVPMTQDEIIAAEVAWERLKTDVAEARKHEDVVKLEAQLAGVKIQATEVGLGARFEVVNAAYIPVDPKQPTPRLLGIGVIFLFGVMGSALSVVEAMLDPRIFRSRDLRRTVRVMAVVPIVEKPGRVRSFVRSVRQRAKAVFYRRVLARLPFRLGQRARP